MRTYYDFNLTQQRQRGKLRITMLKKIVVVGPESTGKSTLCEKLAAHYNTIWVKEYARVKMEEICVYEVKDGKIVKEQFFF